MKAYNGILTKKNGREKLLKFILLFNLFFNIFITSFCLKERNSDDKNSKICIWTLGKEENKYIREFVEHYKNYGVDKIYLYDNNEVNGERFENVIDDYISQGLVEIINCRGNKSLLYKVMNDCYYKNSNKYDG